MTQEELTAPGGPPDGPIADVAIFDTLVAAFAATFRDPALLLRAALGGLLLLAAANILALFLPPGLFALLLSVAAPLIAYTHFGVNWYRVILLGPGGVVKPTLSWDRRHWLFLGAGLALGGVELVLAAALSRIAPLPLALVIIVLLYLGARFSFLFPAIAVAEPYSPGYAWRHTQGQGARLTVLQLLAGLPLIVAIMMIVGVLFVALLGVSIFDIMALQQGGGLQPGDSVPFQVSPLALLCVKMITEALTMAAVAVQITIVALAFSRCTGWVPATPTGIAEVFGAADDDPADERGDDEGNDDASRR
jgi:hypothetical protein